MILQNPNTGGAGELDVDIDVKSVLLDIRSEVRKNNQKFDRLERTVNDLKYNHDHLKIDHENLKLNHDNLKVENEELSKKVDNLNMKVDQLENQSRRDNLVFHGLADEDEESWVDSEAKVRKYISEDLGIDETDVSIERAHRLNTRYSPRPVIVKFSHFKDRDKVLRKYRDSKKEAQREEQENEIPGEDHTNSQDQQAGVTAGSETEVRVSEDFSARVRRVRRALGPFLRDYLKESRNAYIKLDKLMVDGVYFVYDERLKKLVRE